MAKHAPPRVNELGVEEIEAGLRDFTPEELTALVQRANREYWEDHAATLPDPLYDRLVERLRSVDPGAAVLQELGERVPEGPRLDAESVARVPPQERFGGTVVHERPMLSLDKVYSADDLASWGAKIEGDFVVMPKLDGMACSLRYVGGKLVLAATRGSGSEGEDVTMNVLEIPGVPNEVAGGGDFEVRGEVYMRLSAFAPFSEQYSNPRNLTAGSLKNKDRSKSRTHALTLGAYDLQGTDATSEREKFERLRELGIPTVDHEFVTREMLAEAFIGFSNRRDGLDYEIDGVVYRADLVSEHERLGATGHHPRYAMAFKFQGDTGETGLEDILWSVSRSGTITPVAQVVPIELSGAMIGRMSLHNLNRFRELDLRRGARLEVTRRGGVIPYVERAVEHGEGDPFLVPTRCPACGNAVEVRQKRDGEFLQCVDPRNCVTAKLRELEHFAKVLDMDGFGPKSIAQLADAGLLSAPADYFRLHVEDIAGLERLGHRSAQNLVDQVEAHATVPLPIFLEALGIDHLGPQNALLLAGAFGSLDRVRAMGREDLMEIKGIKEAIAHALVGGLAAMSEQVDALLEHMTVEEYEAPEAPTGEGAPLEGTSFVFTGALEAFERKRAQARVKELGGETPSGVSKTLTYLVIGAGRGAKSSKQKKAEKLIEAGAALQIIDEAAFLAMVGDL